MARQKKSKIPGKLRTLVDLATKSKKLRLEEVKV